MISDRKQNKSPITLVECTPDIHSPTVDLISKKTKKMLSWFLEALNRGVHDF